MNNEQLKITGIVTLSQEVTIGKKNNKCTIPAGDYRLGYSGYPVLEFLEYNPVKRGYGLSHKECEKLWQKGLLYNKA